MRKLLLTLAAVVILLSFVCCGEDAATDIDTDADTVNTNDAPATDTDVPDDGIPRECVYRVLSSSGYKGEKDVDSLKYGYDEKGRLIYVREDGKTEPFLTVSYGTDGRISEIFDTSGGFDERQKFENGKLVYTGEYLKGGTNAVTAAGYAYDEAGRITSEWNYDTEGNVAKTVNYIYELDDLGNATAKYAVNAAYSELKFLIWDAEYDEGGRLICERRYNPEETTPYFYRTYEYDGAGRITAKNDCDAYEEDGAIKYSVTGREEYTYDADGKVTMWAQYYDGGHNDFSLETVEVYTYDGEGRLVSVEFGSTRFDLSGSFSYSYDENGCVTSYRCTYPRADGTTSGEGNDYTYREFYLTADEIAILKENDAITSQYTPYYGMYDVLSKYGLNDAVTTNR